MTETVRLPDVGDSVKSVTVVELLARPGQKVSQGQPILTVEANKVDLEVHAPRSGVIREYLVDTDDKVAVGAPIYLLEAQS